MQTFVVHSMEKPDFIGTIICLSSKYGKILTMDINLHNSKKSSTFAVKFGNDEL